MSFPSIESQLYSAVSKRKIVESYNSTGASADSAEVRIDGARNILFILQVTAMTGAGQTQDIKIQHRLKSSDDWLDYASLTQVVVAGGASWNQVVSSAKPILPRIRVSRTAGGTTTTLAYKLYMVYEQGPRGRFVNHGAIS